MKRLTGILKRYRNSRGFGVHSPFGFEFTRRVIRIGADYTFYAEKDIKQAGTSLNIPAGEINHAIKLHRLAAMLETASIIYGQGMTDLKRIALKRAGCTLFPFSDIVLSETNKGSAILIGNDHEFEDKIIERFLSHNGNAVLLYSSYPFKTASDLLTKTKSGIVFEGFHCALAVSRCQTQPNLYKVSF